MPVVPVASTTLLTSDVTRVGKVVKANVLVWARDANGIAAHVDVAELDDASATLWLNAIKDWKKKLYYRQLFAKLRAAEKKKA